MKITKDKLTDFLYELMLYIDLRRSVVGNIDLLEELKAEFEKVKVVFDSLKNDELEIEGYERSVWTKLDLDNPKTFPPNDTMVLYSCQGEVYYGNFTDVSKSSLFEVGTTFWRPLPNPPQ